MIDLHLHFEQQPTNAHYSIKHFYTHVQLYNANIGFPRTHTVVTCSLDLLLDTVYFAVARKF